jgi:hypothetical protein
MFPALLIGKEIEGELSVLLWPNINYVLDERILIKIILKLNSVALVHKLTI